MLTQRLFPKFSELQLWEDGVDATHPHRDAIDEAARASARRMRELRPCRDAVGRRRYGPEEMDAIMSSCRVDCQKKQITPTKTNIFAQYVVRVRRNMHVCLCMSPLGETFRERLRQFPSLVNCSTIDWFTEWPAEALESVGLSALVEAGQVVPENRPGVVQMFKQIHQDVEKKSKEFYDVLRRYNYVTPTSYLELLSSFDTLLQYKRGEVATKKNRLKIGLDKIISTGELVEGMQKARDAVLKLKLNLVRVATPS